MAKESDKTEKKRIVLDEGRELPQTSANVQMPSVKPPKESAKKETKDKK
jgi:hypothetical protein